MTGMVEALEQQDNVSAYQEMAFYERLGLLVDQAFSRRQHNKLDRQLDQKFILELAACNFIPHAQNIILVGPTGAGKSYLAQAFGQAACRRFISTRYVQLPDLLDELHLAKAKGLEPYHRLRKQFVKYELLINHHCIPV